MYIYYKYHRQVREFLKAQRKIKKSHVAMRGLFYSPKNGKMIQYESSLEGDLLTLMEFDHDVKTFLEQPVTISYNHNGKALSYTPDLLVKYYEDEKPLLIEVKYQEYLEKNKESLEPKFQAAKEYCSSKGYDFKVLTEKEIRTPLLENAKFLKSYRRTPIYQPLMSPINLYLRKHGPSSALEIMKGCSDEEEKQANILFTIWGMLSLRLLNADLSQPLTMHTQLSK